MPRINALGTILTVSPACNRSPAMDVGANCWSWSSNCTQALGSLSRSHTWDGSSAIYMDCVREKPMVSHRLSCGLDRGHATMEFSGGHPDRFGDRCVGCRFTGDLQACTSGTTHRRCDRRGHLGGLR